MLVRCSRMLKIFSANKKKKVLSLLYVDDEDSTSHIHGYYMVICVCIHC